MTVSLAAGCANPPPPPHSLPHRLLHSRLHRRLRRRQGSAVSNTSEVVVAEWVIQDEPGLYIIVRELHRFRREKFVEMNAQMW